MIKAVIVDDIERIRKDYMASIKAHCPGVSIIGEADSVASAVRVITQLAPDLVFLDVDLPDGTGFDVLQKL